MLSPTFEETSAVLRRMGFVAHDDNPSFLDHRDWFVDKSSIDYGIPLQIYIYDSAAGYCCVDMDGDWMAPVGTPEEGVELLEFMKKHYIHIRPSIVYMWPDGDVSSEMESNKSDDVVRFYSSMTDKDIKKLVIAYMGENYQHVDELVNEIESYFR